MDNQTDQLVASAWWRRAPGFVEMRFPEVEGWDLLSPRRLMGRARQGVVLVVVDRERYDLTGLWLTEEDAANPELVSRHFGKLHEDLGARIGRQIACEDGTPLRSKHNVLACAWCGASWEAHDGNGTPKSSYEQRSNG